MLSKNIRVLKLHFLTNKIILACYMLSFVTKVYIAIAKGNEKWIIIYVGYILTHEDLVFVK